MWPVLYSALNLVNNLKSLYKLNMKLLLAAFVFVFSLLIGNTAKAKNICDNISLMKIMPYMPADYRIISKKPLKDTNLCDILVQINSQIIPIYANSHIAIVGAAYKNGISLTKKEISSYLKAQFKKNFEKYKNDLKQCVAATYKPKPSTKRFFYLITNPDDPLCENAKQDIKNIAKKFNVGIKVIFVQPEGKSKRVENFICSKKTFKDYINSNYGDKSSCKNAINYLKKTNNLIFNNLKINSLPFLIDKQGKSQSGINPELIKKFIKNIK